MNVRIGMLLLGVVSVALSIGGCKKSNAATAVSDAAGWTTYGRTNDEQRFSPLQQINEQNIGQLGLLWSRELGATRGLEATPLVSNGTIYTLGISE
jgi:quinohemoprotein ethanol dehydrogenase